MLMKPGKYRILKYSFENIFSVLIEYDGKPFFLYVPLTYGSFDNCATVGDSFEFGDEDVVIVGRKKVDDYTPKDLVSDIKNTFMKTKPAQIEVESFDIILKR